jgi:hypothetical protein
MYTKPQTRKESEMNSFNNEVAVPNSQPTTEGENKMEKTTTLIEVIHDARIHDYQLAAYIVNGYKSARYDEQFSEVQTQPIGLTDIMNKTDEYNERLASNVEFAKANAFQRERLSEAYRKQSEMVDTFQLFIEKLFDRDYLSEESDLWNILEELFESNMLERPFYEVRTLKFDVVTTQRVTVTCKVPKSYEEDELYDLFSARIRDAADNGDLDYIDTDESDEVGDIDINVDDPDVEVETAG